MEAIGIKGRDCRQRSFRQNSLLAAVVVVVPGTVISLALLDTGIIKIYIQERKQDSSGGYKPVATTPAVTEHIQEVNPAVGSYHDFIHCNYGSVSQRYYNASGERA